MMIRVTAAGALTLTTRERLSASIRSGFVSWSPSFEHGRLGR